MKKITVTQKEWDRLRDLNASLAKRNEELCRRFSSTAEELSECESDSCEAQEDLCLFAREVIEQFAYHIQYRKAPHYSSGGLVVLERAFQICGLPDPCPAPPECICQVKGCREWAEGAYRTPHGYRTLCAKHALEMRRASDKEALPARKTPESAGK